MKEYTTHFDKIFDMNSTDKYHNMTDRMMTRAGFLNAISNYYRDAVKLSEPITTEQLGRSRELYELSRNDKWTYSYPTREWADYNRLMEAVDSINGMCNLENKYSVEILTNKVNLLFINKDYECTTILSETYNTPDNPSLKDALQKVLIRYYTEIRKVK